MSPIKGKRCYSCGEVKDRGEFNRKARNGDGLRGQCRDCQKAEAREYTGRPEVKARQREVSRRWWRDNPEKARAFFQRHKIKKRSHKAGRRALVKAQTEGTVDYELILERDGFVCHICLRRIEEPADLEFDHVIPLSKGGPHSMDNIKPSHMRCNRSKGVSLVAH